MTAPSFATQKTFTETPEVVETKNNNNWGKIMVGIRLEKMVEARFVATAFSWITAGLRPGDMWGVSEGRVAHNAANELVRKLLKTDCDSILFVDSDAELDVDFISRFRDHEAGWEFDALQAFYLVRQWPPEAIWFKRDDNGTLQKCLVFAEATEEVAIVGLHCALIRRSVFEKMLGDDDPMVHDWFYYPRNQQMTEDAAFSFDAAEHGFKLGATSAVVANHIAHLSIGWESYQEYIYSSGKVEQIERFSHLVELMKQFTGESESDIVRKSQLGNKNVDDAWDKYKPEGAVETREFYGLPDNGYLYDLINWNSSPTYISITRPLENYYGCNVLVIGAGLGSEAEILAKKNVVSVFEFPGILYDFCKARLGESVTYLHNEWPIYNILTAEKFNLVVAIDVIEHIHPDEFDRTMEAIAAAIPVGGQLYCHNNFGQQELYPMHFNHQDKFNAWLQENNFTQTNQFVYTKGESK